MQLMKHYDILKSNLIALFLDDSRDEIDNDINKKTYRLRVIEQLQYFNDIVRKQPPKDYNQLKPMNLKEPDRSRKSPRRANTKSNPLAYLMTNFLAAKKYDDKREKLKSLLMSINGDTYAYKSKEEERDLNHHLNNLFDTLTRHELKTKLRRATNQMLNDEDKLDMNQMTGTINAEIKFFDDFINKSNLLIIEEEETDNDDDDTNDNDNNDNDKDKVILEPLAYLALILSYEQYSNIRNDLKSIVFDVNNDKYKYRSQKERTLLKSHLEALVDSLAKHQELIRNRKEGDADSDEMKQVEDIMYGEMLFFVNYNRLRLKEEAARNELNNFSSNKTMTKAQPQLSSQFDDLDNWSDDNGHVESDTIKYTRTPARPSMKSYYDDADEDHQPIKSPFKTFRAYEADNRFAGDEFDDYIRNGQRKRLTGRREGKDMKRVNKVLQDDFEQENFIIPKQGGKSISKFREMLIDMIINGNYRIKYIPNAAARDTAEIYCENSVDENGKPRYRLIPTNAKDPLGNDITDLNGDGVDDIVIVDKETLSSSTDIKSFTHLGTRRFGRVLSKQKKVVKNFRSTNGSKVSFKRASTTLIGRLVNIN